MTRNNDAARAATISQSIGITLLAGLVMAMPDTALAQATNESTTQAAKLSELPGADRVNIYTYLEPAFPKDGHFITAAADGKNFLACDKSLWKVVDFDKVVKTKRINCSDSNNSGGILTAYIDSITGKGDVVLLTETGSKAISKQHWEKLIADFSQMQDKNKIAKFAVGDYAAFSMTGNALTRIYKLDPTEKGM